MGEDLISLLIYVALGLIGVIASAYKNKAKRQQASNRQGPVQVPRTFKAEPEKDYEPELGPLMELFEIPKPKAEPEFESVENGPTVEEAGMTVDSWEAAQELAGMEVDSTSSAVEKQVSDIETFEEGQSDIQKMIAKYESLRKQLDADGNTDDIASGEIVSVEAEEEARQKRVLEREFFNARKAIIYSEILKKREY